MDKADIDALANAIVDGLARPLQSEIGARFGETIKEALIVSMDDTLHSYRFVDSLAKRVAMKVAPAINKRMDALEKKMCEQFSKQVLDYLKSVTTND